MVTGKVLQNGKVVEIEKPAPSEAEKAIFVKHQRLLEITSQLPEIKITKAEYYLVDGGYITPTGYLLEQYNARKALLDELKILKEELNV